MFVSCTVFVLSGRGLCEGPIPRPDESYRLWSVSECDQVKISNFDTCCEQVEEGRTAKRNEVASSVQTSAVTWFIRVRIKVKIRFFINNGQFVKRSWINLQLLCAYLSFCLRLLCQYHFKFLSGVARRLE
jgi:hypothetical protein